MRDEPYGRNPALTELRARLNDRLAQARLNKSLLARRAGLGRTTVSEAFKDGGPVPSAETVAALGDALGLPVGELLELRRSAVIGPVVAAADGAGLGRPIGRWEPHELEVHPAGPPPASGADVAAAGALPGCVARAHDGALAAAVQDAAAGRSRLLVLVGTSSTGKTRACWEAAQPLAPRGGGCGTPSTRPARRPRWRSWAGSGRGRWSG
ncbi:helix-turn-helix domain-containing protein [Streptomyces sp. NPDC056387]|uniref:helix-turn-helix domain-containing protein n=1 Tax=Streptomyces sp. NPDC056387 TaxID=3345803 RepID=UPI0035D69E2F